MVLEVYLDLCSQPCRSVYMFAKHNEIPFDFKKVSLFQGKELRRARVHEFLSWQHTALRLHGSKIFWLRVLIPKVLGEEVPQDKMEAALEDLNSSLKLVEEKFLQDRPFIAGDHISLADLVAVVEIMQPIGSGLDVFESRPRLSAWQQRVRVAVGTELFDEAHREILASREMVKTMDASKLQIYKPKILKLFL
ncbi:hypothetical protein CRUP_014780 [Coryphaenoides rupestris]|nr:hypothetical protein CRUP_014780 [Coryphaenoides rupestris]